MVEVRYLDGLPAIRSSGVLTEQRELGTVWLWDCGPEEPILPDEPIPPAVPISDPKYQLESLRHKRAVKRYEDALIEYDRLEKEYEHWHKNVRGPIELRRDSTIAREALIHDGDAVKDGRQKKLRYYISSRTRGWEKSRNLGLPNGVVPGPGHREDLERELAGEKEFVEVLKKDPQFGQVERHP